MGKRIEKDKPMQKRLEKAKQKRKACIMKKTVELSILCDVEAFAVIVDDDGEVSTWPETHSEVMKVLQKSRGSADDHGVEKKVVPVEELNDDDLLELDTSIFEDLLDEPREELLNNAADVGNDDDRHGLLKEVDSKLQAVKERIEFLKKTAEGLNESSQNIPNYLLEYTPDDSFFEMEPITPPLVSSEVQQSGTIIGSTQSPCFFEYPTNQQNNIVDVSSITGPFEMISEVETMQTPCFFQYIPNQQNILDMMASAATGPFEVKPAFQTIQNPCFLNYMSYQESIVDMTSTPGFFNDVPVMAVSDQGFPSMVPQFIGDNSQQMIHMVPQLSYFGDNSQQFSTQFSSMNWNNDLFF